MARVKMTGAEKAAHRIVLNRAAFDAITLAVADGAFDLARAIVDDAHAPDAPPYGVGLTKRHGVVAYVGRRRVAATEPLGGYDYVKVTPPSGNYLADALAAGTAGRVSNTVKKPQAAKLTTFGITVIGGYGFPGRFQEAGTAKQPARPFLTPSLLAHLPGAEGFIKLAAIRHKIVGAQRAAKGDTYQASKAARLAKAAIT